MSNNLFGNGTSSPLGQIVIGADVTSGGTVNITNDLRGDLTVQGNCEGLLSVGNKLWGDLMLNGAGTNTGTIDVGGTLVRYGRIVSEGLYDGVLNIGEAMRLATLIHLNGGLGANGQVTINASEGDFSALGTIHVGPVLIPVQLDPTWQSIYT